MKKYFCGMIVTIMMIGIAMNVAAENFNNSFLTGWHLMSFPCETTTSNPLDLFTTGYDDVFGIENGDMKYYTELSSAGAGRGYWTYFADSTETAIDCNPVTSPTYLTQLYPGWNVIGSPYVTTRWNETTIDGVSVSISPKIVSSLYGYDNETESYFLTNIMNSWKGYFVKTSSEGTLSFSPLSTNSAPIADAGENTNWFVGGYYETERMVEGQDGLTAEYSFHEISYELDGSASSDPDGDSLTYIWSQISGPSVTLSSYNYSVAIFIPKEESTYQFQLEVSDGLLSATDVVSISTKKLSGKLVIAAPNGPTFDIYTMDLEDTSGNGLKRITDHSGTDFGPQWSPDGTKIAYTSNMDGDNEIFIMNQDGTEKTQLTENTYSDGNPDWSSNDRIVYASDIGGHYELYDMNIFGTDTRKLTNITQPIPVPRYSALFDKIAFEADYGGDNSEIAVIDSDGNGFLRLTNDTRINSSFNWTNDGRILYTDRESYLNDNVDLYIINSDGTGNELWPKPAGITEISTNVMSNDGEFIFFRRDDSSLNVMYSDGSAYTMLIDICNTTDYHPGL